jgi:hypothetical protein
MIIQLVAPSEVRETRECDDCAFHYHEYDYGDFCNLGLPLYQACKMNFTPEEMKIILDEVLETEKFMNHPCVIEYLTLSGCIDNNNYVPVYPMNPDGGSYE